MLQTFIYLVGDVDPRPVPEEDLEFGQNCIEYFVGRILRLDVGSKVPNCYHYILHAIGQCRGLKTHYGVLTAYPYENGCRFTKRFLNAGNCKAEQFRNRLLESDLYLYARDENDRIVRDANGCPATGWGPARDDLKVFREGVKYHFQIGHKYKKLIFPTFLLSTAVGDSFCILKAPTSLVRDKRCIFRITDIQIRSDDGKVFLFGHIYTKKKSLYQEPEDSVWRDVFAFSEMSNVVSAFPADNVRGKLFAMPRFAHLKESLTELSVADVGENFEKVKEWSGVRLRHVHADIPVEELNSLY
jgi:hypothetical protein